MAASDVTSPQLLRSAALTYISSALCRRGSIPRPAACGLRDLTIELLTFAVENRSEMKRRGRNRGDWKSGIVAWISFSVTPLIRKRKLGTKSTRKSFRCQNEVVCKIWGRCIWKCARDARIDRQTDTLFLINYMKSSSHVRLLLIGPRGLTLSWWRCYGLCHRHKPTMLAHSFLFCCCVCVCLYGPFNSISFYKIQNTQEIKRTLFN